MSSTGSTLRRADVVVAGAGVLGLGVALEAVLRGLRVVVVERDTRPSGASVRNFGHGCLTAQTGVAGAYADVARRRWLELRAAGVPVEEAGTVVVARSRAERAVLEEFAADRRGEVQLLEPGEVEDRVPVAREDLQGGAFLPRDLRVDPRRAVPRLASYVAELGVEVCWSTSALGADTGVLHTSRGDVHAETVVLALGHDLDRVLPDAAAGVRRCSLQMLRVANPTSRTIDPAVLTGTSLLRYSGFLACASAADVRAELAARRPELLDAEVNLMLTQLPDGDLVVGDTHTYGDTPSPFASTELDALLLAETCRLLGVPALHVRERWLGTYAWAPDRDFLVTSPAPGVVAAAITSGIGMTTALGFAAALLDDAPEVLEAAPTVAPVP